MTVGHVGEHDEPTIHLPQELVHAVRRRDCVPFIGAGVSRLSGMQGWGDIVGGIRDSLSEQLGYPIGVGELDFLQVPQVYAALVSSHSLNQRLDEAFSGDFQPNDCHRALAQMPIDTYVTTNWDGLLEQAMTETPFRAPVQALYRDDQVADWSEAQRTSVIKLHGTISDHRSIVFTEPQYLDRYGADSLIFQLVRVLLSSRSVLMVGFGYTDSYVKLLFHQVSKLVAESRRTHWFVTFEDHLTPAFREYLRQVGFTPVVVPPYASDPSAVCRFLQLLAAETTTVVHDRASRARLLRRVMEPLPTYPGPDRILRIRASLGPFGSPAPDPAEYVFESAERDVEEHQLHQMCVDLLTKHDFKVRLLGRPSSLDALVEKGYTRPQALRRIEAFSATARQMGDRFEFAPLESRSDRNQWIAANRSVVESWKGPIGSNRLYSRAMLREDRAAVSLAIRLFDEDFREAQERVGGAEQARAQLLDELDAILRNA